MMPWTHLHVWPNSQVYPCCATPLERPIGNVRDASLLEIWNDAPLRRMRLAMLDDRPSPECERCYEIERMGGGSLRTFANGRFGGHADFVEATGADGSLPRLNLPYIDFRFSNVCNFACRSCGPLLSSRWYADDVKLNGVNDQPKLLRATGDPGELISQIEPILDGVEEIYFAGGEPLLMDEHYQLLELLCQRRMFKVRLRYSTNFSQTVYQQHDVMAVWDRFESVEVGASLDGSGARGEYLRTGQDWSQVLDNRQRMREVCPRVSFFVAFALSAMNVLHLPEAHREWLEQRFIDAAGLHVTLVQFPEHLRIQILPPRLKEQVREVYRRHLEQVVEPLGEAAAGVRRDLVCALHFLDDEDRSSSLPVFANYMTRLDELRGESFAAVFPEMAELLSARRRLVTVVRT